MRTKIIFLIVSMLGIFSISVFGQTNVLPSPGSIPYYVLYGAAIAGVLLRTYLSGKKGISNLVNGSPMSLDWGYWFKDNLLPKITTVLVFITSSQFKINLTDTSTKGLVILGVCSFVGGYFLDSIVDLVKTAIPKSQPQDLAKIADLTQQVSQVNTQQ